MASGEHVYPVLTTSATAAPLAENAAGTETTGAFSSDVLVPSRIQASFLFSTESRARMSGLDQALRDDLSSALSDKLDQQILAGANGLFGGTNLDDHDASAVFTFANYKSGFAYGRVDGQWAGSVADLRIVMGSATYAHAANTYRSSGSNADSTDAALSVLMGATAGVRVSANVPAAASNKQEAVCKAR